MKKKIFSALTAIDRMKVPAGSALIVLTLAGCSPSEGDGPGTTGTGAGSTTGGDGDGSGSTTGQGTGSTSGSTGTGGEVGEAPGGVKLEGKPEYYSIVRLTHEQWKNSIADIFEKDLASDLTDTLYPDPPSGTFANNERGLYVGPELWADYQRATEQVADKLVEDNAALAALGGISDSGSFIDRVGRRAFRRSLTAEEKSAFMSIWQEGATIFDSGDENADGARLFLRALLQSPHFVYRIESSAPGTRLSGLELATKLSLLLRNTTPSDELLSLAESGKLDTDAGLTEVATQMLEEELAKEAVLEFHTELYGLDRYKNIEKSQTAFPNFSESTKDTLREADEMFFSSIYQQEGGVRDILTSNIAFVNKDIAQYYGLTSNSTELEQVTLDPSRPGFLTNAGFLTYNATLAQSDPIHRGVDINLRMLCRQLSPPSGTIPPLPEPIPNQTNRERVEAHTGEAVCAKCHMVIINPLGFAFENFDAVGRVRTTDAGKPVNTADTYEFNDGLKSFADSVELIDLLAEHQQTHSCYSARLAEYVLGRDLNSREEDLVATVSAASYDSDASIKQMVLTTILDPMFTHAQTGAAQ